MQVFLGTNAGNKTIDEIFEESIEKTMEELENGNSDIFSATYINTKSTH